MPSDAHSTSSRRNDRMVAILAMLRDRDEVPLRDMASALGASAATIRRDVVSLAEQGLLIPVSYTHLTLPTNREV